MKNLKTFWTSYNNRAFTLIELIIVISIIALIAAAVFVSVDPAKRLGEAKDAVRVSDALAIEKAIQKAIAEGASVPAPMVALTEDTPYMLVTEGAATSGTCNCNTLDQSINRIDLAGEFKTYLGNDVPVDEDATGDDTGYYIIRKGNSFYVEPCNAYGDDYVYVPPSPETVTCYFDQYDVGGEEWPTDPGYMVDGNTSTAAFFSGVSDIQRLTNSTCSSETFGTISQVRVRQHGYCYFNICGNTLRPVFGGIVDGPGFYEDVSIGNGYRSWYDITSISGAPGTWSSSDIVNLDMDVEATSTDGNPNFHGVAQVQIEVTHTP